MNMVEMWPRLAVLFHNLTQSLFKVKYYWATHGPLQCISRERDCNFTGEKKMTPLPVQLSRGGAEKIVTVPLPML